MTNLKRNLVIAAMGVVVAGGSFFAGSYFFSPATTAQSVNLQEIQKQQEVEQLKKEAVFLQQESSSASSSSAASEERPAVKQPAIVQISEPAVPAISASSLAPQSITSSSAVPAKPTKVENEGTVFEGYTVTVTDSKTPAVRAAGIDWPITKYYFIADDGDYLGSISGAAMNAIIEEYMMPSTGDAPGGRGEWEFWFAEKFNAYRGISDSSPGETNSRTDGADTGGSSNVDINFDASGLASEAFDLVNAERVSADLNEVEMDSNMMELAEMRAEELAEKYDHERPNGTRMSTEYKCAEIINRRANTASIAVSSWMNSSGHKDIILKEKYNSAGIGCYKGEDGTVYWCMLFSK